MTSSSFILFTVAMLAATACTNVGRLGSRTPSSTVNYSETSDGDNAGNFRLLTVLPTQNASGTSYDMVGENAEFDTFCSGSGNTCACEFTYTQSGSEQSSVGASTYRESNLMRCTNTVPSGIASFNARVIVQGTGSFTGYQSNPISVSLSSGAFAGSDSYLNLTAENSYVQVKRFQCRRRGNNGTPLIVNPLDTDMVDPIQAEDPRVVYPFNFYTTNLSESLLQMQRIANQDWECSLTATQDRSIHWWANPMVFSSASCTSSFCSGDGELIYPTTSLDSGKIPVTNLSATGKRRSSFALASKPYGVFQIPVRAGVAPNSYVSANYKIIGYAASKIPGVGTSSCPNIDLPANASWVKLWNYSANDIPSPKYVSNSEAIYNSAVVCSPNDTFFQSCANSGFNRSLASVSATAPAGYMANRVIAIAGNGIDPSTSPNACYDFSVTTTLWPNSTDYPNGSEWWKPSPYAFEGNFPVAGANGLPWGTYEQVTNLCGTGTTAKYGINNAGCTGAVPNALPVAVMPIDNQITTSDVSSTLLSDQIFVVSDPSVNDSLMLADSNPEYRPVTYPSKIDCNANTQVGCPNGNRISWHNVAKEVGNPSSADIYPLCVLQFND